MAEMHWYLARNNRKLGPFTSYQLMELVGVGFVSRDDQVLPEGATRWVAATEVPGLFEDDDQDKYWLSHEGETRGPYVVEQLRAGLATKKWTLDAEVWSDDTGETMKLRQLTEVRDKVPSTSALSRSQAKLMMGSIELEEARLHLAGKKGDQLARLMSMLMDIRRNFADFPTLVAAVDESLDSLRKRRDALILRAAEVD